MRLALGGVDRGDHAVELAPGGLAAVAEGRVVVAGQLDRELAPHLALPLLDQRRGHEDQDRAGQPPHHQLGEDQPRLDGLAQPDLVAEQGPAAEPPQDGLGRADLVLEQLDVAHQGQRDQPVEPGLRRQPGRLDRQVELVQLEAGRATAAGRLMTGQSPRSKSIGMPCSVVTEPFGRNAAPRLDDQPEPARRPVFQPERAIGSGDALGQLRHRDRAGRGSSVRSSGRPAGSSICSIGNPSGPRTRGRLSRPVPPIGVTSNRSPGSRPGGTKSERVGTAIHSDFGAATMVSRSETHSLPKSIIPAARDAVRGPAPQRAIGRQISPDHPNTPIIKLQRPTCWDTLGENDRASKRFFSSMMHR